MSDEIPASGLMELDNMLARLPKWVKAVCGVHDVALADVLGHIVADTILAPYALPPFDNTGVDGYAFRHKNYQGSLKLVGQSLAGEPWQGELPTGCAAHIATGAVLPHGADTVAMQEYVKLDGDRIFIDPMPPEGANIRRKGNDIQKDAVVVAVGRRLQPQDIALCGALGLTQMKVKRRLRIGILATGTELRDAGSTLGVGQIIDTNSLMLRQMLANYPVDVDMLGALPDDRAATDVALKAASKKYDLVISTGGVSVGKRDYIRDAMLDIGKVHFWKLALRPGRPVMFGHIGDCLLLGLPGNPVSVMVTFYVVALPVLQALWGIVPCYPPAMSVVSLECITKEKHLRSFPRAKLEQGDGVLKARVLADQSSNLITSLTQSDGLLDLPTGISEIAAGDLVNFRPYSSFVI